VPDPAKPVMLTSFAAYTQANYQGTAYVMRPSSTNSSWPPTRHPNTRQKRHNVLRSTSLTLLMTPYPLSRGFLWPRAAAAVLPRPCVFRGLERPQAGQRHARVLQIPQHHCVRTTALCTSIVLSVLLRTSDTPTPLCKFSYSTVPHCTVSILLSVLLSTAHCSQQYAVFYTVVCSGV